MLIKSKSNDRSGFTLVEIMIVIAIIGLLAAVALPSFVKARGTTQKNACINNLKEIDGAKEQWAIENKKKQGDACVSADINVYIKGGVPSLCPSGGNYTIDVVGNPPACSLATLGHSY